MAWDRPSVRNWSIAGVVAGVAVMLLLVARERSKHPPQQERAPAGRSSADGESSTGRSPHDEPGEERREPVPLPNLIARLKELQADELPDSAVDERADVMHQIAEHGARARDAVPVLIPFLEAKELDTFLVVVSTLDAIDPQWMNQADQPKLLVRLTKHCQTNLQTIGDVVLKLLPRFGPKAQSEYARLVPLTCHPSEEIRDAAWKALHEVNAEHRSDNAAVARELDTMLFWAEQEESPETGGELLAKSFINCTVDVETVLDPLVGKLAWGGEKTRRLVLVALDSSFKGWRTNHPVRKTVADLIQRMSTQPKRDAAPPLDEAPTSLSARIWSALRSQAMNAAGRVDAWERSEADRKQREAATRRPMRDDLNRPSVPPPESPYAELARRRQFEANESLRLLREATASPSPLRDGQRLLQMSQSARSEYAHVLHQGVANFLVRVAPQDTAVVELFQSWSESGMIAIREIGRAALNQVKARP